MNQTDSWWCIRQIKSVGLDKILNVIWGTSPSPGPIWTSVIPPPLQRGLRFTPNSPSSLCFNFGEDIIEIDHFPIITATSCFDGETLVQEGWGGEWCSSKIMHLFGQDAFFHLELALVKNMKRGVGLGLVLGSNENMWRPGLKSDLICIFETKSL